MENSLKSVLAISGTLLITQGTSTIAAQNPCEFNNKNAIHCAYSSQIGNLGKYIKVKETHQGLSPFTMIFCATNKHTILNIAQNQSAIYPVGTNVRWEFSQCNDENCSTSKPLLDDTFQITKSDNTFSSQPKQVVDIPIDANYGTNCNPNNTQDLTKKHLDDSALQMYIDDAIHMVACIPSAMDDTLRTLERMRAYAVQATDGTHSSSELFNLNKTFQGLKKEMDKWQHINTLSGLKSVSGGSLSIQIGSEYPLGVDIPQTDKWGLNIAADDLLSQSDALITLSHIDIAITTVNNALSMKKS